MLDGNDVEKLKKMLHEELLQYICDFVIGVFLGEHDLTGALYIELPDFCEFRTSRHTILTSFPVIL